MDQKKFSVWLKAILLGIGLCGLVVYCYALPECGRTIISDYPEFASWYWPWLIFLWFTALPCFASLVLGWRIAGNIGKDRSFCPENAVHLQRIAYLAAGDTLFFFAGNVVMTVLGMSHPGVMLASLFVCFVGVAVTVAAVCLSHLTRKAADLQEQSDLTV